jgi:hypothetical protein
MTPQVISAIAFVLLLGAWFLRERGRFNKQYHETRKTIDAALPRLVANTAARYEAKYGRPSSVLEGLQVAKR